jgi:hypothetical protein
MARRRTLAITKHYQAVFCQYIFGRYFNGYRYYTFFLMRMVQITVDLLFSWREFLIIRHFTALTEL